MHCSVCVWVCVRERETERWRANCNYAGGEVESTILHRTMSKIELKLIKTHKGLGGDFEWTNTHLSAME